jgi:predicted GNAT family acetyltransferase
MIERFTDAQSFLAVAQPFLMEHESENAVLAIALRLAGDPSAAAAPYFAVARADGNVCAAAACPAPGRLAVSWMRDATPIAALARDVASALPDTRDMSGPDPATEQLAQQLAPLLGLRARCRMRMLLHELTRVQLPSPIAPGRLRRAVIADLEVTTAWTEAFSAAIGEPVDAAQLARARIAAGTVVVWEDREPVAMAGYGRKTPNGVSISLVYTPDALRGRGYASACVGTLSQVLLDEGNRHVALYTDVTNPISNGIYRKLGYRVVGEASAHALE